MGAEQAKGTFSEPATFAEPDVEICRLNAEEMNEFLTEENAHLRHENAKKKAMQPPKFSSAVTHAEPDVKPPQRYPPKDIDCPPFCPNCDCPHCKSYGKKW